MFYGDWETAFHMFEDSSGHRTNNLIPDLFQFIEINGMARTTSIIYSL